MHPRRIPAETFSAPIRRNGATKTTDAADPAARKGPAAMDPAKAANSSSSSWLHSMLHRSTNTGSHSAHGLKRSVSTAEMEIEAAIGVLERAGLRLDGLQQMQLDRIRMQAELYDKHKLQQRREQLAAELKAAAATSLGAAAASSDQQLQSLGSMNSSSWSGIPGVYSRGILMVAGSRDQMANALVSIIILRRVLNCTLPIELVYYSTDEQDPVMLNILHKYVEVEGSEAARLAIVNGSEKHVDLDHHYRSWSGSSSSRSSGRSTAAAMRNGITGYATKVHALAYVTSFQQVS